MGNRGKNRQRLLVISRDYQVRNDLVTLLTGYGYYVDYVQNRSEGLAKFKQYKQPVVLIDAAALPRHPGRMFRLFSAYKRNPIILIVAGDGEEARLYPYLKKGIFDIIHLPLNVDYVEVVLRRLVEYNRLIARYEFLRAVVMLLLLLIPLGVLGSWVLWGKW